jgi:hypothetical protein
LSVRRNSERTHCMRGHEFTPENTRWRGHKRNCRSCQRIQTKWKGNLRNAEKRYCMRGHEFTPENTYFRRGDKKNRGCVTCRREVHAVKSNAKRYGLTVAEYKDLISKQRGLCAICEKPDKRKRLSVDHDHCTGVNREGLCSRCNLTLGGVQDDPELLLRMVEYLRKHRGGKSA